MRKIAYIVVLLCTVVLVLGIAAPAAAQECGCPNPCYSPGYWKNHADAWPVAGLTIGGEYYTKAEIISFMNMPVAGDKTYTLFKALVAAMLNDINGCQHCCVVQGAMDNADDWFADNPVGSMVRGSSCEWKVGECYYLILDAWNNS
jgi:hypothetical protein